MSLFLRKECQQLLDDVGLEMYHIQVGETNKNLEIVGECGQLLTTIAGIRLSRMAPNKDEIVLAIELFDDFLAAHTGTFKQFIAAKIRADAASIPREVPGLLNAEVTAPYYNEVWALSFSMGSIPTIKVVVDSSGNVKIPAIAANLVTDPKDDINHHLSTKEEYAVREWIKACNEYNIATKEKTSLLEILNTCSI
jgi:hypothetical protein